MPLVKPKAPDGIINIETQVRTDNFNAGIRRVQKSSVSAMQSLLVGAGRVAQILSVVGTIVKTFAKLVLGVTIGFFLLIVAIQRFTSRLFTALERNIDKTSPYVKMIEQLRQEFGQLEGSLYALFATVLQASFPFLVRFVNFMTNLLDKASMLLAALTGQKTVLKAIVRQQQEQKKAAEGTLAAFDQLDVLQKQQEEQDQSLLTFQEVPVTQEAIDMVEKLKMKFSDAVTNIRNWWKLTIQTIIDVWKTFVDAWNNFWENTTIGQVLSSILSNAIETWRLILVHAIETFLEVKQAVLQTLHGVMEFLQGVFTGNWQLAWQGLVDIVDGIFDAIWAVIRGTFTTILDFLMGWLRFAEIVLTPIVTWVKDVFVGAWEFAKEKLGGIWNEIESRWEGMFNGIKEFTKNIVNVIIGFVNGMISAVVGGINAVIGALNNIQIEIPSWVPEFGGQVFGLNLPTFEAPQIPRLAAGAVIPPNAQFLAVMGDQTAGRNLEAPESLLRQIVREETSGMQSNITIKFEGGMAELVRQLKPYIDRENIRVGNSFITGNVTV